MPSSIATDVRVVGDLGLGKVYGKVTDSVTGAPIAGATVTCEHSSYTSNEAERCNRSATTDQDGIFLFETILFHDTDRITLTIDAAGYNTTTVKQESFTQPIFEANIQLALIGSQ